MLSERAYADEEEQTRCAGNLFAIATKRHNSWGSRSTEPPNGGRLAKGLRNCRLSLRESSDHNNPRS